MICMDEDGLTNRVFTCRESLVFLDHIQSVGRGDAVPECVWRQIRSRGVAFNGAKNGTYGLEPVSVTNLSNSALRGQVEGEALDCRACVP